MKKLLLLLLLLSLGSSVIAEDDYYDTAHKLATCSGNFEISADIFKSIGGGEAQITAVRERANGWFIASIVFFMTDGMSSEGSWSSSQGVKDTTMSYWMARIESSFNEFHSDEENMESFFKVVDELGDINTNECIIYDELVEEAIKVFRRMASS